MLAVTLVAALATSAISLGDGGGRATALAVADGKVWTTVRGGIVPLDARTGRLSGGARSTGQVAELASGAGSVWGLRPWTLVRIDPLRRTVRELHVHGPAYALAVGFGSVWVANVRDGTLSRIDARTGRTVSTIHGVGREAEGVAVGFGSVWVSSVGPWRKGRGGVMVPLGRGTVTRIDPARNAVVARIRVGRGAAAIAAGEDGVWVANARGIRPANTVSRIDPASDTVRATIRMARGAAAIAAGAGGVWIVASPRSAGGVLARIDPRTDLVSTTRLRPSWIPGTVLVYKGHVWVADEGTATVLRLDPRTLRGTAAHIRIPA